MITKDDAFRIFSSFLGYFDGETPEAICVDFLLDYPDEGLEFRYDFDTTYLAPAEVRTVIKLIKRGMSATEATKSAREARQTIYDAMTEALMNNRNN